MSVRSFDGTDDKIVLGGTGIALGNGAHTIVAIAKPVALTSDDAYVGFQNGSSGLIGSLVSGGGTARLGYNTDSPFAVAEMNVSTSVWNILICGKVAGTSAIRFSRSPVNSASWTHASGATIADDSRTHDRTEIGAYLNGGFSSPLNAVIAVVALFNVDLDTTARESIQTTPSTQKLADLGAVALWDLNQASTSTAVEDLVGSADQTSLTGTTVVGGDDPPGWTFGLSGAAAAIPTLVMAPPLPA